jgi:hypothetical protein
MVAITDGSGNGAGMVAATLPLNPELPQPERPRCQDTRQKQFHVQTAELSGQRIRIFDDQNISTCVASGSEGAGMKQT